MHVVAHQPEAPGAIRSDLGAIFVSLELSRSTWLITSLSPCAGEKMSKHGVAAGDIGALLARFPLCWKLTAAMDLGGLRSKRDIDDVSTYIAGSH